MIFCHIWILQDLHAAFATKNLILTAAIGAAPSTIDAAYDIPSMYKYLVRRVRSFCKPVFLIRIRSGSHGSVDPDPGKQKFKKIIFLSSLLRWKHECSLHGPKKTHMIVFVQKMFLFHKNRGLNPNQNPDWIRIQQHPGSLSPDSVNLDPINCCKHPYLKW